ncbi:ABC transporter substrate-binding protein [Ruminococcaceae bacterium OttesenSCG-928-D13]|nr:ABC transporter substrate-binding protein [Ruminococcaceae bacterium OttesenSCG-928-D13]
MKFAKRWLALAICLVLVFCTACSGGTPAASGNAGGGGGGGGGGAAAGGDYPPIPVTLLSMPVFEIETNAIRDQLTKAGFDVTVNMQPDRASYVHVQDSGEYDMGILSWLTDASAPDFAVRMLFHNDGAYNSWPIVDDELSAMIDEAAQMTFEESIPLYTKIENRLVDEMCWVHPLFNRTRLTAVNTDVIVPESVFLGAGTPRFYGTTEYVDMSQSETRPFVPAQQQTSPPNFDPLRSEEGSTFYMKSNAYISLTACDKDDMVVPEYSLSQAIATGEGNDSFYFLLRDNVNFAKVENNQAVDTGVLVSAEDVVFTMERAKDVDAVPLNSGYTNLESVDTVGIVTDLDVLKNINVSGSSQSVYDYFNEIASSEIKELTDVTADVDNAGGVYQVVEITTMPPPPQLINFLTISTLGIVSKQAVTAANEGIDASNYDPSTDVLYGDVSTLTEGSSNFNNNNWFSGPYAMLYINDYEMAFERNPGFMPGTEQAAKIKYMNLKMISDMNTIFSALRSGEVDDCMPEGNLGSLNDASNVEVLRNDSTSVFNLFFNLKEGSKMTDLNLRKAVHYIINQDELIAVKEGNVARAHSTLTMIPTGNEWNPDPEKAAEYIKAYYDSQS